MNALTADNDAAVQMIDTSIVGVHQHGACIAAHSEQLMGRSRGGLTTKIHAVSIPVGYPSISRRPLAKRTTTVSSVPCCLL